MKILYTSVLITLLIFTAFSQNANYQFKDSTWIYVPMTIDSLVMNDDFIPRRCKNDLSDSLSILIDSFKNRSFTATYDSTISYTYQFTQIVDLETDFQNKLAKKDICFEVEENRNLNELKSSNEYILYDDEWLAIVVHGIPRIGNSTYWKDYYIYFKRNLCH